MSVIMSKAEGVPVFSSTSDPQSSCPPSCQILKGLCWFASQLLRKIQRNSQSVLGTLHIMVGLLTIILGAILVGSDPYSWWLMDSSLFPVWFGGVFMLFGTICILSEKCPCPCLVILNVILNLAGVVLAIAAIVLYIINITTGLWWMDRHVGPCDNPPPDVDCCLSVRFSMPMRVRHINAVLIVLSVLELCVTISSAVLGIKALRSKEKKDNKSAEDPEHAKTMLEEVPSHYSA